MIRMISEENINYSLKNLWIKKSRSILTLISIFIGITTIFIFISFGLGLYNYINELASGGTADKFMVSGKGSTAPGMSEIKMSENDLKTVEGTKGVIEASGYFMKVVEIEQDTSKRYVFVSGIEPRSMKQLMESMSIKLEKGRELDKGDVGKVALGYNYQISNKIFPKQTM